MTTPRWKLLVEGLGKIALAEVTVHPLMLFVGDNNSGKSHLASVLWGLLARPRDLPLPAGPTLSACEAWLDQRLTDPNRGAVYQLSPEDKALFTRLFNGLIHKDDIFVKSVFNSPAMAATRLEVTPLHDSLMQIHWESALHLAGAAVTDPQQKKLYRALVLKDLASQAALGPPTTFDGTAYQQGAPIFLPASRSGFMLLYQAAARRGFEQAVQPTSAGESWLKMSRPAYQFIDLLAFGMTNRQGPYAAEAALLESGLDGRIDLISGPVGINEYAYSPSGSGSASPLHLSLASSLVTELAPIILVLRHLSGFPILVLEEPEAHLHPKLQRKLAQVIVRLIRKGLYVWITTHSENFCQQINNFMKIGAIADRTKLNAEMQQELGHAYGEQDYLTPDDVAGYEFVNQGDHSIVKELAKYPDGLVMPTFNREMVALGREITFLEQRLDEGT